MYGVLIYCVTYMVIFAILYLHMFHVEDLEHNWFLQLDEILGFLPNRQNCKALSENRVHFQESAGTAIILKHSALFCTFCSYFGQK